MNSLIEKTSKLLGYIREQFEASPLFGKYLSSIKKLEVELLDPCVLAVAGQVSAGKSTFVNALLEFELAEVGINETTATLTYFKFDPKANDPIIECCWKDGTVSNGSIELLNSAQGHDEKTLKRIEGISHFNVYLNKPFLKEVTIVDTPGTGSVEEVHENRTSKIIEQHTEATENLAKTAGAIIYMFGSPAGNVDQKKYLESFQSSIGSNARPINAIGVISKVDKSKALFENQKEYTDKLSKQLKNELNLVASVSVALHLALATIKKNSRLDKIYSTLRTISPETVQILLEDYEIFDEYDVPGCPISAKERKLLRAGIPWTVFKIIATELLKHTPMQALDRLQALSGFEELKTILHQHFFSRAKLLASHNALSRLRRILETAERKDLTGLKKNAVSHQKRYDRFTNFLTRQAETYPVANELLSFIEQSELKKDFYKEQEELLNRCIVKVEALLDELNMFNEDFYALTYLAECDESFCEEEREEIYQLLGRYGMAWEIRLKGIDQDRIDYIGKRQRFWRSKCRQLPTGGKEYLVAKTVEHRYGKALGHILKFKKDD